MTKPPLHSWPEIAASLEEALCEIATELGCESDNEMILAAICNLKTERDAAILVQRNASIALDQLRAALLKAEEADQQHINCDECDPEEAPEGCWRCFPLADDARTMRWAALGINQPPSTEPVAKNALHDRLAEAIDPSAAPDGYGDLMLCRIHAEIQNSHPEVTVEHRNIVLHAVAEAIRHPPTEIDGRK